MNTPDTHPAATSLTWFLSADWALLSSELAAIFLVFALIVGMLAWLGRRRRLNAARALINERESIAETATETFNQHLTALLPEASVTSEALDDYLQRSQELISALVEPWLEPSTRGLQNAVREVMGIRHTDLHQVAAFFRAQPATVTDEKTKETLEQLKTDLVSLQKAEAERSAQLAEALKSVSIIVSEYGRKFGIEADFRAPRILRTLIYLQGIEQGLDHDAAMNQADFAMESGVNLTEDEDESEAKAVPASAKAATAVAAKETDTKEATAKEATTKEATTKEATTKEATTKEATAKEATAKEAAAVAPPPAMVDPTELMPEEPVTQKKATVADEPASASDEVFKEVGEVVSDGDGVMEEVASGSEAMSQIDLDDIELPAEAKELPAAPAFELNLDDIDALLDAEISKQQSSYDDSAAEGTSLSDDDLDLSKKPPV
ncbi:hypothetical protein [Halothiobacillus sp.]|uniref:hypothetical protein n=1 Tax=Halothiobacillus sp. TaxID=1891311 RepID=UPI002AD200FD|nr:hypothetical protein [Halothiobacillus sp.]